MFVGRMAELRQLNKLYDKNEFQFVVVYGRRRVGKTFMLSKFCEDKKAIYFAVEQFSENILLEKFSDCITSVFPSSVISNFESFEKAILYLGEKAKTERVVVVIDEFQYWAEQNKGILSALQNLIDHSLLETNLFLIICGSYISFMEGEVLGYQSPLYGRRTAQFKIEEFGYKDSSYILPQYEPEEMVLTYAMLGGIPMYLKQFDGDNSLRDNVIEKMLWSGAILRSEPIFALRQELREPAIYMSILEAIAGGASKYNEISTKCGVDIGVYLNNLIQLGILRKEVPFGAKPSTRKSIYRIKDNFFHFWFRFITRSISLIEQEKYDIVYDQIIEPRLSEYAGYAFEDICIQFLKQMNGTENLPFIFHNIGRWWGTDSRKKCEVEIDIIASNDESKMLFGECKWRNEKTDITILQGLIEKSLLIPANQRYYCLFSKSGFTPPLLKFAKERADIYLFTLRDIF